MPPQKRSHRAMRDADADIHDEPRDVEAASSSNASIKRARVSLNPPNKRASARSHPSSQASSDNGGGYDGADIDHEIEAPENDDEEDNGDESENTRNLPPASQYELLRDNAFKHLSNPDHDDHRATQRIKQRSSRVGDNNAADSGIIEHIECINFMCHERLYVDLGPLINFIVGENGSGKSAVLTALTLCLGGKASSTNRGGNLKSFIKEGKDQSIISVTIKNQGMLACQPDLYGDTITVERHFSRAGTSGFRLKDERGKTVSTKKSDVDEIAEWWSMQIDNPLIVLSQDNARQFLNASTPAQKYKFFFKGVQLEQLDNDYKYISETLESHEAKLPAIREQAERAQREYVEAQRFKEAADGNRELRAERQRLGEKLAWSLVQDEEQELELRQSRVDEYASKIEEIELQIADASQKLEDYDKEVEKNQAEIANVLEEKAGADEAEQQAQADFTTAKDDVTRLHQESRQVHTKIKSAQAQVKQWEVGIVKEEQRLSESGESDRLRVEQGLKEAKEKEAAIRSDMERTETQIPELVTKVRDAQVAAERFQQTISAKRSETNDAQARLQRLQQSRTGKSLDAKVDRLLKAIQNDNGFDRKPLGPIGAYIQLQKPSWSRILEATFGKFLDNFVVSSKRDQTRLSGLMRQCGLNNTGIIIGGRLGASLREPDEKYLTVLRALKIDDDWIRDQLVIQHSIEKIILIESREEGQRVMWGSDRSKISDPPANVAVCITHHDTIRDSGIRLAKGSRTSTVRGWRGEPRMKSDIETQIAFQRETVEQLEQDLQGCERESRRLQGDVQSCKAAERQQKEARGDLKRQLVHAQARVQELEEELDTFDGADGRLSSLQENLKEAQEELSFLGKQFGEMEVRKAELNKVAERRSRELQAQKLEVRDFEAKVTKLEKRAQRGGDLRRMALMNKNNAYESRRRTIEDQERAEESRNAQAASVANVTEQAQRVTPERPSFAEGETSSSIRKSWDSIGKRLSRTKERIGMSDEDIYRLLEERKAARNKWREFHDAQKELQRVGKISLDDRIRKWQDFQRHISAHARVTFLSLLQDRGFRGMLLFSHKERKLLMTIEPDETQKSNAGRSTKTLSGGEKSFSSICLLLALWDGIGTPLRGLDEFDVFMDNINRTVSTNMLISAARRSVGRQYILITPNAIEGRAKLGKDVKVIRLTDPRQRTLI